ncbi:MAG: hypothetical protein HYY05_01090 [Chloroflexi bacterium]|nr:hypothetical protein [Chloroflexota bacterium]
MGRCLVALWTLAAGGTLALGGIQDTLADRDYTAWTDVGIVYGAGSEKAYYPSVIYDREGFRPHPRRDERGSEQHRPRYKMWYSDGDGTVKVTASNNGRDWSPAVVNTGLTNGHHVQTLYDERGFGNTGGPYYKIWYWDFGDLYSINAIRYAESQDGVAWTNDQAITQDPSKPLISPSGWNRGSYGPVDVLYNRRATNTGTSPSDHRYVMYYDGTDGSSEVTGLAYSVDGKRWAAVSPFPVLDKGPTGSWDADDAVYGTVLRDGKGYHFWYSGGGPNAGDPVHKGIGYAFSSDGISWTKASNNPIFHVTDPGAVHRSKRTYTPAVVRSGSDGLNLKMFYSARSAAGDYAIGLALLEQGMDD